jgi:hypothetical protein
LRDKRSGLIYVAVNWRSENCAADLYKPTTSVGSPFFAEPSKSFSSIRGLFKPYLGFHFKEKVVFDAEQQTS